MVEQIDEALCNRPLLPFTIRLTDGTASGRARRVLTPPLINTIEFPR